MIPVCTPTLAGKELEYVTDCIKTNWISSMGAYIEKFEKSFSEFCNAKYGVSCSNGTTALHLALASLGIGKGNEVIVPSFTMVASANSVLYTGAKPVFVDSELETWNMDVKKVKGLINDNTKAIMPVHTYGHPVDMDPLLKIAKKNSLFIIEDAAEAHGAEYKGRRVGSLGDVACFSFYGNKILTTGEGGMVVTNDEKIAEKARLLRNHAFTKPRFLHYEMGFNYRLTNIQAAIGLAQVERADYLVERRIQNAKLYNSFLKDTKGLTLPPQAEWAKNVYWMYGILVGEQFGLNKEGLMEKLKTLGIETRSFFVPMHKQPLFIKMLGEMSNCPNAEYLGERGLYIPSSSSLSKEEITKVADTIKSLQK